MTSAREIEMKSPTLPYFRSAVRIAVLFAAVLIPAQRSLLAADDDRRPNIVLILADDLGWRGVGCYGSTFYETPNIDRLATQGVRFTAAFSAASTCAPSRASIMSGQYTPKHRVLYVGPGDYQDRWKGRTGNLKRFRMIQPRGETVLPSGVQTLAENLKSSGYRTAMFGKWHLGNRENHPGNRGFDVAIESHGKHFGFHTDPEIDHPPNQYLSDFLSDQAVKFIEQSAAEREPFFLYYPDFLVHKPFEAKEEYLKHFAAKKPSPHQKSPMAGAMIKSLDDSVGKIMAALDRHALANNTLVVFTSDNGGLSYEEDGVREQNTSNLPLRGRKGSEYDGGLRVPWIVRWPGKVPAGSDCDTPIHHVDLFPTFAAVAAATSPPQSLHGKNLIPLFCDPAEGMNNRNLFWYLPGYSAFHTPSVMVRTGDWKLVRRLETEQYDLFETAKDIGESKDVSQEEPQRAASLNRAAMRFLDEMDAPRMTPNPQYDPQTDR
jgi:arylsulfatase A-like enzyme